MPTILDKQKKVINALRETTGRVEFLEEYRTGANRVMEVLREFALPLIEMGACIPEDVMMGVRPNPFDRLTDYPWEKLDICPLCGTKDIKPEYQDETHSECLRCGVLFQNPRLSPEGQARFYTSVDYRTVTGAGGKVTEGMLLTQKIRADSIADRYLGQWIKKVDRALDFGCSTGTLLDKFRKKYECEVAGVELSEVHRAYANNGMGVSVVATLDEVAGTFDLISLVHVLEHLPYPTDTLRRLRGMLRDDGWLLLEVPHLSKSIPHPICFCRKSLTKCLRLAGFEPEDETWYGQEGASGGNFNHMRVLARKFDGGD